ncbi:MAG TPA: EscU/YscU/HrcU family type III secretion system export apparatus switch protein [Verrucomicrobiae bacterium]|nr:EscU/YscU/HrcU family type III secretion system export apparatus switch protein [Verrucomicrobiae bacterium]
MADDKGDKTEQPTAKKLEDALKQGQIAHSAEVQTVFVLLAGLGALSFTGGETWHQLVAAMVGSFTHLHDTTLSSDSLQGYAVSGLLIFAKCAGPVVLATMTAGVIAGAIQTRFNTSPEALTPNWGRLNPVEGFKRTFSMRNFAPTGMAVIKFSLIVALTYSEITKVLNDPIFQTSVGVGRLAQFLAQTCMDITFRISMSLVVIAGADYGYQWWRTHKDMMMTKEEVKEDSKSSEGNPRMKAARRRKRAISKAKALAAVPTADVVITNPTHIAIALRYDRKTMRAPKVVAKGIRLNAQQIRELAQKHQIPIIENKPLARMLFKQARVGGEVPAALYAAVAEVLAWVYRINRYRYFAEQNAAQ